MSRKIIAQCSIQGCLTNVIAKGLCARCYMQSRRDRGLVPKRASNYGFPCRIAGCAYQAVKKQARLCGRHYERQWKYGDPLKLKNNNGEGNNREERFWSKVAITANNDKCWEWQGRCYSTGYGVAYVTLSDKSRIRSAHRAAYYFIHHRKPTHMILHSCDNRKCVNPKHLREGTHRENMQDRNDRNRTLRGERNPWSKFKDADIPTIRQRFIQGETYAAIARDFQVNLTTIANIVNRRSYRHIP